MTIDLVTSERAFGTQYLPNPESRAFFRHWRRAAATRGKQAWSEIRGAEFRAGGKTFKGAWLITRLRNHLVSLQKGSCCYCRRPLQGIAWAKPIDHVLPKKHFPRHAFHYRNLAVACYDCNHFKSDDDWSDWISSRRKYIPERRCGKFFHPRYHSYDDHVRYLHIATNGASLSVYFGLTTQGKKLCAELLHKSAGRQLALTANPRLEGALSKIRGQAAELEKQAVVGRLDDFLAALEALAAPGV